MQKNQVKLRNHSVDLVKCIAALLVVSVHADAFSEMSPVLENIINGAFGRMAVPFFACVTGYYLTKYTEQNGRAWLNNVKSLLKYYILLSVIYVIWSSLSNQFQEMSVAVIVYTVVKRFVIYGTYYHLWFFPAMILSVIVLHLSIRWHKERLCWMLCLLGVIFGALTYNWHHLISWEQLPVLGRMMGWYDFDYIRRFITLIGPFTFLGNFIFRHKDQWMEKYQTKTFSKAVTVNTPVLSAAFSIDDRDHCTDGQIKYGCKSSRCRMNPPDKPHHKARCEYSNRDRGDRVRIKYLKQLNITCDNGDQISLFTAV